MADASSSFDDVAQSSHNSSGGQTAWTFAGERFLERGPGHSTKQFIHEILKKFGPEAEVQFVSLTADRLGLIIYKFLRWPDSSTPLQEEDFTVIIMPNPQRGKLRISNEDGEVEVRDAKRKRMTTKRHPAFLYVPWYILRGLQDTEEDISNLPRQWGFPMYDAFLSVLCCRECQVITTQLGAYLNDWKQEDDDSQEESTPAATEWTCPRCYGEDLEFHCAQCEIPLFAESHAIQDTNCRPQYADDEDEALMWCSDCSVRISGNFCGG